MKKTYVSLMMIATIVVSSSLSVFANDSSFSKLEEMGFTAAEISGMDNIQKNVFLKLYDRYDGTAKIIPAEDGELSAFSGENDINVVLVAGSVGSCITGYKCKGISIVGGVDKPSWEMDSIKSIVAGAAWADNWNYVNYDGEVDYGDFWGNPVNANMTLIDAVPETGITYKYSNIPEHVNDIYTTVNVDLRRKTGDTGDTDVVGKIGYTSKDVIVSAFVSSAPGITFTPSEKVYQKADTGTFYY